MNVVLDALPGGAGGVAAFAAVVFLGVVVQTVTGFGAMLVCVTLGALLMPIRDVVTLAVPVSLVQTGYIALRHRDGIRWDLLLRRVLPLMGVGLVLGYGLFADATGPLLRRAFGLMVLGLAVRELVLLVRAGSRPAADLAHTGHAVAGTAMLGAGVIHGIYATGGPLLVYALGREGLSKNEFRSTLAIVWLLLNVALTITFVGAGRIDRDSATSVAFLVPAIPLAIVLGELLYRKVDERHFRIVVFTLLIVAALALVLR